MSTYTLRAVSGHEWIYFIFKPNNISQKPQVINHKWVNAGDVVPQVRGEKWRKIYMKRSCHLLDTVPVKQFYHSALHDVFPHKSTAVKIIFIFHFFPPHRPIYNFIISKATWLISVVVAVLLLVVVVAVVVSIIFRKDPLNRLLSHCSGNVYNTFNSKYAMAAQFSN